MEPPSASTLIEELEGGDVSIINVASILGFVGAATGAFHVYEKVVGKDNVM